MTTSAVPKHLVANHRTTLAGCGVAAVLVLWTIGIHATRTSQAMEVELPEYGRNLSAGLFLIAGGARLVSWRIGNDWAAARLGLLLLALGTSLPAGSVLSYAVADSLVARIEAPEGRLLYFLPLVLLALLVSTGHRRRFAIACTIMIGVGCAVAADMALVQTPASGAQFTGLWIVVEAASVAGWVGLGFHAWTRRNTGHVTGVIGWALTAMILMALCELVKIASLTGTRSLLGMSSGFQLAAAAIMTANAVRLLVAHLRQRALDDEIGRTLLLRRDKIDELEQAQRRRLHDARSAVLGVKGASNLLASGNSADDTAVLRSLLSAELDRLQALLETEAPAPCELFDVAGALRPTIAAHRLAGARIHESVSGVAAYGRPVVTATVVDNLLRNAERHAPGANVLVHVRISDDQVEILVEDDGPGIPVDQRDQVLLPGVRGTNAKACGSGLGLSNVAKAMAEQNGSVRIEERRHGGTTVVLTLPTRSWIATDDHAVMVG